MVVGIGRLSLYFPEAASLKDKRQGLRKLIDRLSHVFNVAVAEVGAQDTWQRSIVGLTVVGNDARHVRSMLDKITQAAENLYVAQITARDLHVVHYNDEEALAQRPMRQRQENE